MEITGKVHCFFEQSGTFKNEFKKLGYDAEDYDIQNNFGETDNVIDLFQHIEDAYEGKVSVFDKIGGGDLIVAFFPCIYFEALQMTYYTETCNNNKNQGKKKFDIIIDRIEKRNRLYVILYKLVGVCEMKNIRMIIENPATQPHYLLFSENFYKKPTFIDKDRTLRGDWFKKPTAWWFFNCEPTNGKSFQKNSSKKTIQNSKQGENGLCSEERSLIAPNYARNFICDFILGKKQKYTLRDLFND